MKRNKLILLFLIALSVNMTGCKFIEKAPEKTSTEESTIEENLGSIDENAKNPEKIQESTEETTVESEAKEEEKRTISGVTFIIANTQSTVYAKTEVKMYAEPKEDSSVLLTVNEGSPLIRYATSEDGKWIMCKNSSSKMSYVLASGVSDEYVKEKFEETPEETKEDSKQEESTKSSSSVVSQIPNKEESKSEQTQPAQSQSSQQQQQSSQQESQAPQQQQSSTPSQQPPKQEVNGYLTSGIPFPDNASSTSINLGVQFADVSEILYVTIDGTTANSGPGAAISSTGYEVRATYTAGTAVQCSGIGKNGYCRVELANGVIAFIEGTHLERR